MLLCCEDDRKGKQCRILYFPTDIDRTLLFRVCTCILVIRSLAQRAKSPRIPSKESRHPPLTPHARSHTNDSRNESKMVSQPITQTTPLCRSINWLRGRPLPGDSDLTDKWTSVRGYVLILCVYVLWMYTFSSRMFACSYFILRLPKM